MKLKKPRGQKKRPRLQKTFPHLFESKKKKNQTYNPKRGKKKKKTQGNTKAGKAFLEGNRIWRGRDEERFGNPKLNEFLCRIRSLSFGFLDFCDIVDERERKKV